MSDTDTPTGDPGGPAAPSEPNFVELPERMRVHELARLLSVSSRDVLSALADLGEDARSAQSSIDRAVAVQVVEALLPSPGEESDLVVPETTEDPDSAGSPRLAPVFAAPMFLPPAAVEPEPVADSDYEDDTGDETGDDAEDEIADDSGDDQSSADGSRRRRRRGRRGRGRGRGGEGDESASESDGSSEDAPGRDDGEAKDDAEPADSDSDDDSDSDSPSRRRRRRRRRRTGSGDGESSTDAERDGGDDPPHTVTHVREPRDGRDARDENGDGVQGVRGSTRLEAKRQRRRDGRDAGRRRAPILTEAEFLARRESVERSMVVRQHGERIEIAVLEDGVLVEHFVTGRGSDSLVGNIYLGRVQNVLPSMEAAFIDIGRGRNAVLYAGEVDWDAAGLAGKARKIEQALSSGDSVLVQVTKDPIGHKGARLTTQLSLAGRFLVYVPSGGATGISRKLPDTERKRLKDLLKQIVPEDAGVIIRTASEGVSHAALERDVRRLQAQWEVVRTKAEGATGTAESNGGDGRATKGRNGKGAAKAKVPQLLYEEPDLLVKVVRDQFNEDFSRLVVSGEDAWDTIDAYVRHVAPELADRVHRHVGTDDVFTEFRIDEQLAKALDRKVWLPSGGTLVIDRTEAMTVIDVNTGKFTGAGGNLEETVTRNNLEAAEEIVRQLRLRDIGGIIVIDFIDMVLESNRDLVLRRLTECLGRDRTRHQVSEVTSLGLVQMTRKRVGVGLLEAFSTPCEHCRGRGVVVSTEPVVVAADTQPGSGSRRRGRGQRGSENGGRSGTDVAVESTVEPAPAEAAPTEPTPTESAPADSTPAEPAQAESAAADSTPAEPPQAPLAEIVATPLSEPVQAEPVQAEPLSEPVQAEPVPAEPVQAEPVPARPVPAESIDADAVEAVVVTVPDAVPIEQGDGHTGAGPVPEPATAEPAQQASERPARRRRRSASRPAGPPSVSTTADPV